MKKPLTAFAFLTSMTALAQPNPAPVMRAASAALDEIVTLGRTQPIPVEKAPKGCVYQHTAKYCRPDGKAITHVQVLEERTLGLTSVKEPRIEAGCVVLEMSLAVPVSKTNADRCEGGEPQVSIKMQLGTR